MPEVPMTGRAVMQQTVSYLSRMFADAPTGLTSHMAQLYPELAKKCVAIDLPLRANDVEEVKRACRAYITAWKEARQHYHTCEKMLTHVPRSTKDAEIVTFPTPAGLLGPEQAALL